LNEKNDPVETAIDSVADARAAIQIACNPAVTATPPRVTLRLFSC
jgi:hypothetical protein